MYHPLKDLLQKPEAYRPNVHPFWDDDHISKQMLKAHLDPQQDAASRRPDFMDRSADWIAQAAPPSAFPRLLDLGCGPGLYAERFAQRGWAVTGVDLSRRSVKHAVESAQAKGLDVCYHRLDYCTLDLGRNFDLVTLIYCDFGALSPDGRREVLRRAHAHLRPGGRMVLDVFSVSHAERFEEYARWEVYPDGGFWRADEHITLDRGLRYPDHVTGRQICVISPDGAAAYYLWNTCFSPEMLTAEAESAGFRVCGLFGDAAGAPYTAQSDTLAVVLEKA